MNQLEELTSYLDKMGVPYKVTNKNGELKYVDASNGESTAIYTKEIEVSTTNVVYFIPDLDGFVDPTDDISGGDNDLFVMDAWETARYMGSLYFDEDPEETEKRLNESKEGSTMKKFNCSMQKKIESVTNRNEWYRGEHADIFDDIRRDTSNSWYIGATRMMPKKSGAVTGAIEDDDYRDRFIINFTATCDNFDFGQNSEELKELADTCLSMAITDRSPRTKGDMLVTAVPLGNPVAKGNSWNYDVELKYNDTQKGETKMTCSMQKKKESFRNISEKRTVTKSYDVYTYDELSDEAKEKVKKMFLDWRSDDGMFKEDCVSALNELFPNSDLDIEYQLSYTQGDGFNTSGTLKVDDLLNVDLSYYPLNKSGINPLSDKEAIKAACEDAGISEIKLPVNRRYGYSMADSIELETDSGYSAADLESLPESEVALLNELEDFARSVFKHINGTFKDNGYDYFYEMSDEEASEQADANGYEFTEDGAIA